MKKFMSVLSAAIYYVTIKILSLITRRMHARLALIFTTISMPIGGRKAGDRIETRLEKVNFSDVNVLGNLINTTHGKSSSPSGTYSIKVDLAGETMTMKYSTIVHFASERGLSSQVVRCAEEAIQRLDEYLSLIKKDFKGEAGYSLKTTHVGGNDNVELIQATSNSPRKIAYYRMNRTLTVG